MPVQPDPTAPLDIRPNYRDLHHDVLAKAIPAWLGSASSARRETLKAVTPHIEPWHVNATAAQHQALKPLIGNAWAAQNQVDKAMAELKSPQDFGAPILQHALKQRFGVERDVRSTYLRLYIPATITWFKVKSGAARTWTVSLLEAALHNFEESETREGAYEEASTFITRPGADGHFESLPGVATQITVPAFTRLCRELDIGRQYSAYLEQYLGLQDAATKAALQLKLRQSHQAALKVALQIAHMTGDIPQASVDPLTRLFDGQDCTSLLRHDLSLLSTPLTGIVLFAANLEHSQTVVPVVAYIPGDPEHPLKYYPSTAHFIQELTIKLRQPEYQRFFSHFVGHEQQGSFFALLDTRLSEVTWHPHTRGDARPSWRETPTAAPKLQAVATPFDEDLFEHLYHSHLNKLLNDARSMAVATASVDQQARWRRWDLLGKIGSVLLQVAAFIAAPFVPPLGLLMLGYTAYQLLDDTFEGIVDWAEGVKDQAFEHLMSVLEQLAQLGLFATGLPIAEGLLRQALPAHVWAFFDKLTPVTLADGSSRLWNADLAPYAHDLSLPTDATPDAKGLYRFAGKDILPLAGKHYAVVTDPASGRYRLQHPSRPHAYQPHLYSNDRGAWVSELDYPLTWDRPTLLRRLGHQADALSDAQLEQVRHISGVDDGVLRAHYLNHQPPPAVLADSLKRFKIDRDLHTFVTQLRSADPAVYGHADAQTQLLLLTRYGLWPKTKTLRFLDHQGNVAWEVVGNPDAAVAQIHEEQLTNGDLLKTLLQALDEPERKQLLEEEFGSPPIALEARAKTLRARLADLAQDKHATLFESRYHSLEHTTDAGLQSLINAERGLPLSAAEALLHHASTSEVRELNQGNVPQALRQRARAALHQVRVARAYEGLYRESLASLDTDRLALHSLQRLPGWSSDVRIEVKDYSATGPLRDSIGSADAPIRRTLIRHETGGYTPTTLTGELFGATDLYTAVLQALPDTQRDALGLHIGQGPQLRQALANHALEHRQLSPLLAADPILKPSYDPKTMRLLGGMESYQAAPAQPGGAPSIQAQLRQLYPALSQERIDALIEALRSLPGGPSSAVMALRAQYAQLDNDLAIWESNTPRRSATGERLVLQDYTYARRNRRLWAEEIRRAWRHETEIDDYYEPIIRNGLRLLLSAPIEGELPQLNAHFPHVTLLELHGNEQPVMHLDAFLTLFPNLRLLAVRDVHLGALPAPALGMPYLNELILSNCSITLNAQSAQALSAMTRLKSLDLYKNPLGITPSVANMPNLSFLDLNQTGITQLPTGLMNRPRLEAAILAGNRISELPAELFTLPAPVSERLDLSNNPIPAATLEQVKTYFQRTGSHWEVTPPAGDVARVKALYPSFNDSEVSRFIFGLHGTLEMGRIELTRLEQEYETLQTELTQWALAAPRSQEVPQRQAFKARIEACWRKEAALDDQSTSIIPTYELDIPAPVAGDLPTLGVPFNQVSSLKLQGSGGPLQLTQFLQAFAQLTSLQVENAVLGDIPSTVFQLARLVSLKLPRCGLRLTARADQDLMGLHYLEHLDLSHNPLTHLPDFQQLPRLSRISLQSTGLTELPARLLLPTGRQEINLSHNQISELPEGLFALPASATKAFNLSSNPLSHEALQRIKTYSQSEGEHLQADAPARERARVSALYPTFSTAEANRFVFTLPGDMHAVPRALDALEAEYRQLCADLQAWALDVPAPSPSQGAQMDEQLMATEQINRLMFKTLLEQGWRRESPLDELNGGELATHELTFETPLLGALPRLSARFDHVSRLELSTGDITTDIDGVLRGFTQLKSLSIFRYALGKLPPSIFDIASLTTLSLPECRISLTPNSAGALSAMTQLEYLDLSDNPLGLPIDVSQMTSLHSLYLQETGLTELPPGVLSLRHLATLDVSDNEIVEVPADILERETLFDDETDFGGNPFSPASLERLRRYFLQTGHDLGVMAATQDAAGNPLAPSTPPEPIEE